MTDDLVNAHRLSERACWQITQQTLYVDPRCRNKILLQRYEDHLYDAFQSMQDQYADDPHGYIKKRHEHYGILAAIITPLVVAASLTSYRDLTDLLDKPRDVSRMSQLRALAAARGSFSAQSIQKTTNERLRAFLGQQQDSDAPLSDAELWIFSRDRAKIITDFEGVLGYQTTSENTLRSLALGTWGKEWLIDPDVHQREDTCDENEDAGVIPLGALFPSGDFTDPAHLNCVTGDTILMSPDPVRVAFKRWYQGELVSIKCFDGTQLSVTPNHPVLTEHGWVAAGNLDESDKLVKGSVECLRRTSGVVPNDYLVPTLAEDVTGSFLKAGTMVSTVVPSATEQFHGDGMCQGKVDIVAAYRALEGKSNVTFPQCLAHKGLVARKFSDTELTGVRSFALALELHSAAARGSVSSSSPASNSVGSHFGIGEQSSSTGVSSREIESFEQSHNADAGHTASFSEAQGRFSGAVSLVQIKRISRVEFSGHVYNLETPSHQFFANGLIVHNCGCTVRYRRMS
jgi:hypothetical protein